MVHQLDRYLTTRANLRNDLNSQNRVANAYARLQIGSYLTIGYLFVKLLYVANAVGQLYLLDAFLGTDFHFYGIDVLRRLVSGDDWAASERFPRVTLCEFIVRHQVSILSMVPIIVTYGKHTLFIQDMLYIHTYSSQRTIACTLANNIINNFSFRSHFLCRIYRFLCFISY